MLEETKLHKQTTGPCTDTGIQVELFPCVIIDV